MDMTDPLRGFVFYDPKFDGQTLTRLIDHPVFGPTVKGWIADKRTDWRHMKAVLKMMQMRARRQRKWLGDYESLGDERASCVKGKITYATFYEWKRKDEAFRIKYEGLREMHAMNLLARARELGNLPEQSVDRWNIIKTEIPEYNPKKNQANVTLNLNGDIDFTPKGALPAAQPVETTAEEERGPEVA